MTKHEKITSGLSIIAIAVSILSPIFSFYLFDPTTKAFKERGRLVCSADTNFTFDKDHKPVPIMFSVTIVNIGQREAKEPLIIIGGVSETEDIGVTFDPPLDYTQETRSDKKYITLKRSLAPQHAIRIEFSRRPSKVWVSNEYGEIDSADFTFGGGGGFGGPGSSGGGGKY